MRDYTARDIIIRSAGKVVRPKPDQPDRRRRLCFIGWRAKERHWNVWNSKIASATAPRSCPTQLLNAISAASCSPIESASSQSIYTEQWTIPSHFHYLDVSPSSWNFELQQELRIASFATTLFSCVQSYIELWTKDHVLCAWWMQSSMLVKKEVKR